MSDFSQQTTWWGLGIQKSGMMICVGADGLVGYMRRMSSQAGCYVDGISFRFGLGLGGSAQAMLLLAINAPNITALNGVKQTGVAGAIALPTNRLSTKGLSCLQRIAPRARLVGQEGLKQLTQSLETADAAKDLWTDIQNLNKFSSSKPEFLAVPIPAAGAGAELSLHYSYGDLRFWI